jgi:hypothetical protein
VSEFAVVVEFSCADRENGPRFAFSVELPPAGGKRPVRRQKAKTIASLLCKPSQGRKTMASNVETLLEEKILGRTGRRVRDLRIEFDNECITLHGRTETYHVKQLALSAIREALPQFKILNGIEVE